MLKVFSLFLGGLSFVKVLSLLAAVVGGGSLLYYDPFDWRQSKGELQSSLAAVQKDLQIALHNIDSLTQSIADTAQNSKRAARVLRDRDQQVLELKQELQNEQIISQSNHPCRDVTLADILRGDSTNTLNTSAGSDTSPDSEQYPAVRSHAEGESPGP